MLELCHAGSLIFCLQLEASVTEYLDATPPSAHIGIMIINSGSHFSGGRMAQGLTR
jgi:hypothetical protein